MRSPWDPNREEFAELLADLPRYRQDQLWTGLYTHSTAPSQLSTLPSDLRSTLATQFEPALHEATSQQTPNGDTVKTLWELPGGARVESVLMHYPKRSTVCVSSQAGCAMACGFCATGQAGFERHLTTGEILEQVVNARRHAGERRLSNIVFMGMGEPLANYDRVLEAIRRIIGDMQIGARHITVSTVGMVPQMLRFAEEGLQVGLAVSLHAANDDLRTELVPLNKRHSLDELVAASSNFRDRTGRRVSFEWAMMAGINDRESDALELVPLARRAQAHVNLIPLNPTPGWPTTGTDAAGIRAFARVLEAHDVNVTVRANRGTDISAACGQLHADHKITPVQLSKTRSN